MRGSPRRRTGETMLVSPLRSFAWPAPVVATLRHCSLPWYDLAGPPFALAATPIVEVRELGNRDRLSLLAQFAAHQAFLQFAGIADAELDAAEWAVVRKRGADCRLVRVGARHADVLSAPPVLALAHEFADAIGAPALDVFRQSWARAETVYAEATAALRRDAAADLRWMRRAAAGEVLAPGADVLRDIWSGASKRTKWSDRAVEEGLARLAAFDDSVTLVSLSCEFPLLRYGALSAIDPSLAGSDESEAAVAEKIAARLAERRHVVIAGERLDGASRRAIEIASALETATWVVYDPNSDSPQTRWFVLTPRFELHDILDEQIAAVGDPRPWVERFVDSDAYVEYVESGRLPAADSLTAVHEPKRSYIAALALLGSPVPRDVASSFLATFLFEQPLESLAVEGVVRIDGDGVFFASDAVRNHCASHIPLASRAGLCRAAAAVATGERSAFLSIEAGDVERGVAMLEAIETAAPEIEAERLAHVPRSALSRVLASRLAHALIECGRYGDVADLAPLLEPDEHEIVLAQCDRRSGDYETALARLARISSNRFDALMLRCEILRVAGRYHGAAEALRDAKPGNDEEEIRAAYESSLLALECGSPSDDSWTSRDHYLSARYLTYRALADADFVSSESLARDALRLSRSPVERIDAWLDLVFATFSAGRWAETRVLGLEALGEIERTQGDRAAAGILFTHAYLAADEGHFAAAAATLRRLQHYYSSTNDAERLFELKLIEAHVHFARCELVDARRLAMATLDREALLPQIREAAALIVDEINAIEGREAALRSRGGSGNRELTDRHRMLALQRGDRPTQPVLPFNRELAAWIDGSRPEPPRCETRGQSLKVLRASLMSGRQDLAQSLAKDLGLTLPETVAQPSLEGDVIRIAATGDYPFDADAFGGVRWAYATRNRLGHWIVEGNADVPAADLDHLAAEGRPSWLQCSDREWLFVEGAERWSPQSQQTLAAIVRTRAENHRLRRLVEQDEIAPSKAPGLQGMIGESAAIRAVFDTVHRVARRDVAVCILGESGTGKELVARAVHRESERRAKSFVAVNCAALPENLIESELFGHMRGAFTGADRDRAGLIETSDGGTLFLDEIGEMPLAAQAKLLRFLQDGEFRRVGDTANRNSDVRIIAATNRRLETAVDEGRFREDLYYRIRGVEVLLPPLRDRGNDVVLLARLFLSAERGKHRSGPGAMSADVEALFRAYRWPGNVRELQNAIRAAHAMAGDAREITIEHLPERMRAVVPVRAAAGSYQDAVAKFRRDLIEKSLLEADGNQNRAAALLNISRQALAYQIRELGILVRRGHARSV